MTVVNDMPADYPSVAEGISIHWHGFSMRGSEWYDGTGRITQCPIAPGTNFTYKFQVSRTAPSVQYDTQQLLKRLTAGSGILACIQSAPVMHVILAHLITMRRWMTANDSVTSVL